MARDKNDTATAPLSLTRDGRLSTLSPDERARRRREAAAERQRRFRQKKAEQAQQEAASAPATADATIPRPVAVLMRKTLVEAILTRADMRQFNKKRRHPDGAIMAAYVGAHHPELAPHLDALAVITTTLGTLSPEELAPVELR